MTDATSNGTTPPEPRPAPPRRARRGPLRLFLDLFSSVRLGIVLLFLLFVYASIGSAGLPVKLNILRPDAWMNVREIVEMSEFRWFHWWPFDLIIALICLNLVVTTLRRIPLNVVNLGVWMIHSGIIVLAIGSVWYFGTKVEGDAPVVRRAITAVVGDGEPVEFIASPGNRASVGRGSEAYDLSIVAITPDWELLSGDDAGVRAYKVTVAVRSRERTFLRELIAGYPQYTEDLVASDDPQQPFARAKKTLGTALVDDSITLSLDYAPQEWFCLMESRALYLRELGSREWVERPIIGMPLFKDHLGTPEHAWPTPGYAEPLRPVRVEVPAVHDDDPLPDVPIVLTDYLRYGQLRARRLAGGGGLNPAATLEVRTGDGRSREYELVAFDPQLRSVENGALEMRWVRDAAEFAALANAKEPTLTLAIAESGVMEVIPIRSMSHGDPAFPFTPLGEGGWSYRIEGFENGLDIGSLARVELRDPSGASFVRWVFEDPALTRDMPADGGAAHGGMPSLDERVVASYEPGEPAAIRLVAGPGDADVRLVIPGDGQPASVIPLALGMPVAVGPGTVTLKSYARDSRLVEKPMLVPLASRDRDAGMFFSLARISVPTGGADTFAAWLSYHHYPFREPDETPRRFRFDPALFQTADGRWFEVIFSRRRMRLPTPVALESFEVASHVGGFTGDTSSILDWTSLVVFDDGSGGWTEPLRVHMNNPKEHAGFWYFQSQWDPPERSRGTGDPGSRGLNYTILGVANRHGVVMQLVGCCISVIGMIYAFYVKPWIKRRRRDAVYAAVAVGRTETRTRAATPEEVR